jgi:hypothetical protein
VIAMPARPARVVVFFSHCKPVQVSRIVSSPQSSKQPDSYGVTGVQIVVVVLLLVLVVVLVLVGR